MIASESTQGAVISYGHQIRSRTCNLGFFPSVSPTTCPSVRCSVFSLVRQPRLFFLFIFFVCSAFISSVWPSCIFLSVSFFFLHFSSFLCQQFFFNNLIKLTKPETQKPKKTFVIISSPPTQIKLQQRSENKLCSLHDSKNPSIFSFRFLFANEGKIVVIFHKATKKKSVNKLRYQQRWLMRWWKDFTSPDSTLHILHSPKK